MITDKARISGKSRQATSSKRQFLNSCLHRRQSLHIMDNSRWHRISTNLISSRHNMHRPVYPNNRVRTASVRHLLLPTFVHLLTPTIYILNTTHKLISSPILLSNNNKLQQSNNPQELLTIYNSILPFLDPNQHNSCLSNSINNR